MNVNSGDYYPSIELAKEAGEDPADLVTIFGTEEQVRQVSDKIKAANKAKRKQQRESRRKNR